MRLSMAAKSRTPAWLAAGVAGGERPGNPRALYYNEQVAVGYIRHAPFLELIAHKRAHPADDMISRLSEAIGAGISLIIATLILVPIATFLAIVVGLSLIAWFAAGLAGGAGVDHRAGGGEETMVGGKRMKPCAAGRHQPRGTRAAGPVGDHGHQHDQQNGPHEHQVAPTYRKK